MLESKLPEVGTTIFTVMSKLAADCDALNLSQGFPDFSPPAGLTDAVARYFAGGPNQYAPMAGAPALLEAIAEQIERHYGPQLDPATEITVTPGATEALFCAIHTLVRPGDEVIVFDPAYDSYAPAVKLAGGRTRHLPLLAPDFSVDWDRFSEALSPATRLVIVNSPHNPTGSVWSVEDLNELAARTAGREIFVLSDEVYEHVVFEGRKHATVLTHPELAGRSLAVFSFGKSFHATGWKVGYLAAPPQLTAEFRKVHQFCQFCVVHPVQLGLAEFIRSEPDFLDNLGRFYQERRDHLAAELRPGPLKLLPCAGTYFQTVDYSALSDEPDQTLAERLTREVGVATIPVSVFYQSPPAQRLLRLCFAKDPAVLTEAAARLNNAA